MSHDKTSIKRHIMTSNKHYEVSAIMRHMELSKKRLKVSETNKYTNVHGGRYNMKQYTGRIMLEYATLLRYWESWLCRHRSTWSSASNLSKDQRGRAWQSEAVISHRQIICHLSSMRSISEVANKYVYLTDYPYTFLDRVRLRNSRSWNPAEQQTDSFHGMQPAHVRWLQLCYMLLIPASTIFPFLLLLAHIFVLKCPDDYDKSDFTKHSMN